MFEMIFTSYLEKLIEWQNQLKAYKKQTLDWKSPPKPDLETGLKMSSVDSESDNSIFRELVIRLLIHAIAADLSALYMW